MITDSERLDWLDNNTYDLSGFFESWARNFGNIRAAIDLYIQKQEYDEKNKNTQNE